MKVSHTLISLAVALAATSAASASVEFGCVQVDLDPAGAVCAGAVAPLDVTIGNSCSDTKRVALTFAMDRDPLRGQTASIVAGEEQIRKAVMVEIPGSTAPGTHTLSMTARDVEGNTNAMTVRVRVERCALVGL